MRAMTLPRMKIGHARKGLAKASLPWIIITGQSFIPSSGHDSMMAPMTNSMRVVFIVSFATTLGLSSAMSPRPLKTLCLVALLLLGIGTVHAQQPGVDCAPVQGQGWTGCAPINPSQPLLQGQQPHILQPPPQHWQDHWGAYCHRCNQRNSWNGY